MSPLKKETLPPEFQLLIHCLNAGNEKKLLERRVLDAVDWNFFLKLAGNRHSVLGQIGRNLSEHECEFLPRPVALEIKRRNKRAGLRMLSLTAELLRLLDIFTRAGIPAVPFKGPVLGMQLYGNVTTRHCSDLDIILPRSHAQKARDLLLRSGYKRGVPSYTLTETHEKKYMDRHKHFSLRHSDTSIAVELHWKFFMHLSPLSFETAWKNRVQVTVDGHRVPAIALDDMLILLILHGGQHQWKGLFWVHDIYTILRQYENRDWQKLMDRAEGLGIQRPVYYAFAMASGLFGLQVPRFIKSMMDRDRRVNSLVRLASKKLLDPTLSTSFPLSHIRFVLFYLLFLPNARFAVKKLSGYFLAWEYEYLPLPDRLLFLYFPLRFHLGFFRRYLKIRPASRPPEIL